VQDATRVAKSSTNAVWAQLIGLDVRGDSVMAYFVSAIVFSLKAIKEERYCLLKMLPDGDDPCGAPSEGIRQREFWVSLTIVTWSFM
jgi:hypothetical protein